MVALKQAEIPYYRGVGRQRGRGFGALAQVIGRITSPVSRTNLAPAAKSVGADLLEFAVPEIAEVVSGRKNFKTAAKTVGRQTLKKQLGEGEGSCGRKGVEGGRELAEGSRSCTAGRQGSRRKGTVCGREGASRKRTTSRVIPTKTTKKISLSRGNIFTNVSH